MKQVPDPNEQAAANVAAELAHLHRQADAARAVLTGLRQDVAQARNQLDGKQMASLREANEQLVVATLSAQADTETATQALHDVSRQAELDTLTELPSRALLLDRFAQASAHAKRHSTRLALLFIDLDDFKQINDTLGHAVGDQILKLAAHCLVSSVRAADTVSRYGGDEFLVLLTEVSQDDAILVAGKIIAALRVPCHVGEHVLRLKASIGISIYPEDGEDADTLIDRADAAMYRAKKDGLGSFAFHDLEIADPPELEPPAPEAVSQPAVQPLTHYKLAAAEHERRHGQLLEANEQLLLAALSAQELQAAAERAQQRQTQFLAVVAHELRNPLAPISAAAALLGRVNADGPLLPQVQAIIERQVMHMSRLVSDLLDVSRVNTGKLRLERRTVEIAGIIDAAVDGCRPAIDARGQHFHLHVPACPLKVYGDPVRLEQVVNNLLDNASKYTPDGGEITLSVKVIDAAIVMTLSDSGIGITAEALPNVFEPFVQDSHAIDFSGVGLGIGLTVVRELVEAHGGKVVAESAGAGLGSQLVVTIPLDAAASAIPG